MKRGVGFLKSCFYPCIPSVTASAAFLCPLQRGQPQEQFLLEWNLSAGCWVQSPGFTSSQEIQVFGLAVVLVLFPGPVQSAFQTLFRVLTWPPGRRAWMTLLPAWLPAAWSVGCLSTIAHLQKPSLLSKVPCITWSWQFWNPDYLSICFP